MNDEENDGDADTGIGHVERRPGMREGHMQVEEQEIDDVAVKQPVGEIAENAGDQKRKRQISQKVRH